MAEAKLMVELVGKVEKFTSDMEKAKRSIESVEQSVKSVDKSLKLIKFDAIINLGERAFRAAEQMYNFSKAVASSANDIQRQARIIGITVEVYQQLQYAAKMTDLSNEGLNTGLKQLSRSMEEAANDSGDAAKWFQAMGISVTDAKGTMIPLDEMLKKIADKFASWEDGPKKIAVALALFGRSGMDLIPILNLGSDGIQKYMDELKKLNGVLSDDLIEAGSKAEDKFKVLETKFNALVKQFGIPFAESFVTEIDKMVTAIERFIAAFKKSPLTNWLFKPITGENRLTTAEKEAARINKENMEWENRQYISIKGPQKVPVPSVETEEQKRKREAYEKWLRNIENEIRIEEAKVQTSSHYGANIGMSEGEGLVPGVMKILTDEIETYKRVYDEKSNVIALEAVYREEIIKTEDAVQQMIDAKEKEKRTQEALAKMYSDEFEIQKQLGLEYDVPDALYEKELLHKKINAELEKEAKHLAMIDEAYKKVEEDAEFLIKKQGFAYEVPTVQEISKMDMRSLEREAEEMKKVEKMWADVVQNMGNAFTDGFVDLVKRGFKDIEKFLLDLANQVSSAIIKMFMNYGLYGNVLGGYSSGMGLVGWIGSLFKLKEGGILPGNFIPVKAFAGGGTAYGPTFGMVGEAGPEAVVPLKGGKIPVETKGGGNTYVYITAMDSQSMEDALRRNPNAIMKIVKSNAENAGPMRGIMRSYL